MTICETQIVYDNITIFNVLTEDISYDPVYDQSGTDIIGIHTTVICTAYIHNSGDWYNPEHGINAIWQSGKGQYPAALDAILRKLSMPRRRFIMKIGNKTLFDILPEDTEPGTCNPTQEASRASINQDIAHGPKCKHQVIGIQGSESARVRFTFEFTRPACEDGKKIKDFLQLRYSISDDVDCKTWQTTRAYRGSFRVRGLSVNSMSLARLIAFPPIQYGFRRTRVEFSESPDHLTLNFTIIDKEEYHLAPAPATDWEGSYSISMPLGDLTAEAELRFRLWGDNTLDRRVLFVLAQKIIDAKLHYEEMLRASSNIIVLAQVWEEDLKNNEVNCYIKIAHFGEKDRQLFDQNVQPTGDFFELGKPLDKSVSEFDQNPASREYAIDESYYPPEGPTASLAGIFKCSLQTACCPQQLNRKLEEDDEETEEEEEDGDSAEESTGDTDYIQLPHKTILTRYNKEHHTYPYLWYRMTSRYHRNTGWKGFPLGRQCNTSASSSTSDSFAFAQLHCGTCIREVRIEACRMNQWPTLPDQRDSWEDENGIKYVLKESVVDPCPPKLTADGKHELREIYASYFYYMSRAPRSEDEYLVGQPAYIEHGTRPIDSIEDSAYVPPKSFKDPLEILAKTAPRGSILD